MTLRYNLIPSFSFLQQDFLRKENKAVGPMSNSLRNGKQPYEYESNTSYAKFGGHFS
jgi:hypothetical protein